MNLLSNFFEQLIYDVCTQLQNQTIVGQIQYLKLQLTDVELLQEKRGLSTWEAMLLLYIYSARSPIFYILRIITTKKKKTELNFSEQLILFFIILRFSYENKRKQMVIARNLQSQTGGIETHRTRWPRRDCRNIARDCKPFCSLNNSSKYFYVHTLIILCHRKQ